MATFTLTIEVRQEPGQPDVYRIDAPGIGLPVVYEVLRKLADDLLMREASRRTLVALQELAKEQQKKTSS